MDNQWKMVPINAAIMLPSIVLALYVVPHILGVVYALPFLFITFLPLVKRAVPRQHSHQVYPLVAIGILLLILINLFMQAGLISANSSARFLIIPLTIETGITLTMAISLASIFEGIFSQSLARSISFLTFSLLPLLDQVFVLYLMQNYGYSYVSAYYQAYSQQIMALIALVVTGSTNISGISFPPPLSEYAFPIDPVMLAAMIVSLAAILTYFVVVKETKLRGEALAGVSAALMMGGLIGFAVFYLVKITTSSGFELFVASLALVVTLFYAARSSPERKARKTGAFKNREDW